MREQVVGLFQVESGPHEAAAMLGAVGYVPSDLILASTLWKIGAIFGGLLGAIIGSKRGLEPRLARRYEEHIARGALALAARVHLRRGLYLSKAVPSTCAMSRGPSWRGSVPGPPEA